MKHYTLYEPIASGGMGTVHYGRAVSNSGLSRVVAVKRLRGELARDPRCLAMFRDELRLATRVRHPNVVGTLDMVEQDGELLMVMDLVQGESLQELIARSVNSGQRVPPAIAVSIVCGILQGLEAAHDATSETGEPLGIVHRDVSPENILVGRDGIARLLDFGIARGAGRKYVTRVGEIKGKPSYLAPEQILESSQYVDRRADIWGVSCVLWEALTGRRLFDADSPHATLSRVLTDPIPRPSSIARSLPQELDDAVMRGLSRDRDERYASALDMARELRRVCGTLLPFEVGDWVAQVAGDSLARQAERVARWESTPLEASEAGADPKRLDTLLSVPRDFDEAPESTGPGMVLSLRPHAARAGRGLLGLGLAVTCFLAGLWGVRSLSSRSAATQSAAQPVAVAAPVTPVAPAPPQAVEQPVMTPASPPIPQPASSAKRKKARASAAAVPSAPQPVKLRPIIDDGF
jgi:serine/threonine-protein kinase